MGNIITNGGGVPAAHELITGNYFFIGGRFLEIRAPRRVTGPKSRGLHGKSMENPKKKEAILSKNDDFRKPRFRFSFFLAFFFEKICW